MWTATSRGTPARNIGRVTGRRWRTGNNAPSARFGLTISPLSTSRAEIGDRLELGGRETATGCAVAGGCSKKRRRVDRFFSTASCGLPGSDTSDGNSKSERRSRGGSGCLSARPRSSGSRTRTRCFRAPTCASSGMSGARSTRSAAAARRFVCPTTAEGWSVSVTIWRSSSGTPTGALTGCDLDAVRHEEYGSRCVCGSAHSEWFVRMPAGAARRLPPLVRPPSAEEVAP